MKHDPVMVAEVLQFLPQHIQLAADLTVGAGGHAGKILARTGSEVELIAVDRDVKALDICREHLKSYPNKINYINDSYTNINQYLDENQRLDFALLDLGLSSMQLASQGRGFSFNNKNDQLDLRFNPAHGESLQRKLKSVTLQKLSQILRDYGEVRQPKRIAKEIISARDKGELMTVGDLTNAVDKFTLPHKRNTFLSKIWQSLRIWVNDELEHLKIGLNTISGYLQTDGVLAVITFHSLEDRIVKEFIRSQENRCTCPPRVPFCVCGRKPLLKNLTKKPLKPTSEEIERNPHSRSAKLRAARKLEN